MTSATQAFDVVKFVNAAAVAFPARPDPTRDTFFKGEVEVVPDADLNGDLASANTAIGRMTLSQSTADCLERLHAGHLSKAEAHAARDALVTLFHEFNHFACAKGRGWKSGIDRYVNRRGSRALEEGVSELAAQDVKRFTGFVGRLGLATMDQMAILSAASQHSYRHYESAVDRYLREVTASERGYADALDRVNAVDADQKPAVLADVALEGTPLRQMVSTNRYAEIRAEVEGVVVRGLDDLPDHDRSSGRAQVKAGRRAGRDTARDTSTVLQSHEVRALRQADIKHRWVAVEQHFAAQELRCAAELRAGDPGASARFSAAAVEHQTALQSLRVERLGIVSQEAETERRALSEMSGHYQGQTQKAIDRQCNPVEDSPDHGMAPLHAKTFVLIKDTDTHRLRSLNEWERAHLDDTRHRHDLCAREVDGWQRFAAGARELDPARLERQARGRLARAQRLETAPVDVRDPDLPGGGALAVGRYAPMQIQPAADAAFSGLRPAARASFPPKNHPHRGVGRSNAARYSSQRRAQRAQE